jgi:membrane protease YdiL (CAAX protease family)
VSDSNPPDAPQDRPLTFFSAAIWTLIAFLLNIVIANLTEQARPGAWMDAVSRTGCIALSYSIVFFCVLRLHEPEASIRHILGLRPPSALAILLSLALGAALALPSDWLNNVLESRLPNPADVDEEAAKAALAVTSTGKAISLFLTLSVLEPILTELFYRGVLFTPLRRTRRTESVIVGVAAFESLVTLSYAPRLTMALLASVLVFSWIRGVTGSVYPSIAAHFAFTAVSVIPMCLRKPDIEPTKTLLIASGATALASLVGLSLLSRSARAVDARQRDAGELSL